MASGKSTVAPLLARSLGVPSLDLDQLIEARAGVSVAELFAQRGEAGFRAVEAEVLRELLASPSDGAVVALGGGTVVSRELRHTLLDAGVLVTLDAEDAVLAARVGDGHARPLLAGRAPAQVIGALREARRDAYAECHARIDTGGRSPEHVAGLVAALASETRLVVPLGARSYRVEIGEGLRHRLPQRAQECARGARVLVTDVTVGALWGAETHVSLGAEPPLIEVVLDAGEPAKNLASVEKIWNAALAAGVDRDACVVALGGGVVGDVAGFAASTLLRGLAFGQVPTTLLAMVDSSVGGKTAIDRAEGKNLIGAFHQPRFVLCDVAYLATLPAADRVAGLGEVVKCALLAGEVELAALERDAAALTLGDAAATTRAIRMAVALKAKIVADDEHELTGKRVLLNLGHTLGHALEAESRFALRHGEAVALGVIAALRVAESLALGRAELRERVVRLLVALGLPTDLDPRLGPGTFSWLAQDKKRAAGKVRFVVPVAPGATQIVPLALSELGRLCRGHE
jgi:shikimate kinase/3-dehydroquinate synthase